MKALLDNWDEEQMFIVSDENNTGAFSDTYLRRQACMYEVGEIIRDHHYKDRLLFIVLRENECKYYGESAPEKIGPDIYKGAEDNPTSIMHTELNRQLIKKDRI